MEEWAFAFGKMMSRGYHKLIKLAQEQAGIQHIPGLKPDVQLMPHQKAFIERLIQNRGVIVAAHKVGSGKTLSSIASELMLEAMGNSTGALVVVPAALRKNYADAIKKFTDGVSVQVVGPLGEKGSVHPTDVQKGSQFTIISYELLNRYPQAALQSGANTLIVDEFHRVRNPEGATYDTILALRPAFKNFIGLTGSIVNNDPADVAPLVSLATGQRFLSKSQFKNRFERRVAREKGFFGGEKYLYEMKDTPVLQRAIAPLVDYVGEEIVEAKMPRRDVQEVSVEMSPEQEKYYNYVLNRVGPLTAWRIRHNVAVPKEDLKTVFQSLIHARRASNSVGAVVKGMPLEVSAEVTPKVRRLLDDTVKELTSVPDAQVVIYSNLINGGLDVVAAGLKKRGIPFGVFIGKGREFGDTTSTEQARTEDVDAFRKGKLKVLLISGAGAEGLDLPNTTLFQALDGHFNPERILQAEARGRRIGGLAHRPPEQRVVKIRRYVSTLERGLIDKILGRKETSVDEWIYNVAKKKFALNQQFVTALRGGQRPPTVRLENILAALPKRERTTSTGPQGGTELPKDPTAKYEKRWRMPDGEIRYRYSGGAT